MPQTRTIAVLLALSALLCAGWTKTTHWHFKGHFQGHSSSPAAHAGGACCSAGVEKSESHATPELACVALGSPTSASTLPASTLPANPAVEAGQSHLGEHCSVCDFLASHVYGLAMVYGYAGTVAECQWLTELLMDAPSLRSLWVTCRGPPMSA